MHRWLEMFFLVRLTRRWAQSRVAASRVVLSEWPDCSWEASLPNKSWFLKDCCCSIGNFCLFYSSPLCLFQRDVNRGDGIAKGVATVGSNVPKVHFPRFISWSQHCSRVCTLRHRQVFSLWTVYRLKVFSKSQSSILYLSRLSYNTVFN